VESAETWENSGKGQNMGKRWKKPKHGKTVESAETWENGGRTSETWHWSVAKWRKRGKRPERENSLEREKPAVTVESAENVGKRWPHGQKRGKTVVAWPKWRKTVVGRPKRGKTVAGWPKRRENGGTSTETGERD
jgi:hypothetical protein